MDYTVKNFFKGEYIFKEGSIGKKAYLIKSGKVAISKKIKGENVTLAILERGAIFGEMALLNNFKRTASVKAVEYVELVVIEQEQYLFFLKSSPKIIRSIISSLIQKLSETTSRIPLQKSDNLFFSICRIIYLLGKTVQSQKLVSPKRPYAQKDKEKVSLNYSEVLSTIEEVISLSSLDLEKILKKLNSINLLKLERVSRKEKLVIIPNIDNFLSQARKIYQEFKDSLAINFPQEKIFMDLGELSLLSNISADLIYKKIGWGEVPENLFFFPREEILKWIKDKGSDFFSRKKMRRKKIEELEEIKDLIYVDNETIQVVLGEIELIKICKIMKEADEETEERIFSNLSSRMQGIVKQTLAEIETVDPLEVADIEELIISRIKEYKQKQRKGN